MLELGGNNGLSLKWGKCILSCSASMKWSIFLFHELPFHFFFCTYIKNLLVF